MPLQTAAMLEPQETFVAVHPRAGSRCLEPQVVRGRKEILRRQRLLERLCKRFDQEGEADNLDHFLTSAVALRKQPILILLPAEQAGARDDCDGIGGAALFFEYMFKGVPLKLCASSDWTGRRNLIAPLEDRPALAAAACRTLIDLGNHAAFLAFHSPKPNPDAPAAIRQVLKTNGPRDEGCWSLANRDVPLYLPLGPTFDATMARIGQKTRANLRYYRRRAEAQLGAEFVADVEMSCEEFVTFSQLASYPAPIHVAHERYHGMATLRQAFLSGVRGADGRWLSLVMGWYRHNAVEIEWQMNRADLREYSLSTVMRSFLIDHAIRRGCERLYIEGGTRQPIQQSFHRECASDLTLLRRSPYMRVLKRFAKHVFPEDNHLGSLLANEELHWEDW